MKKIIYLPVLLLTCMYAPAQNNKPFIAYTPAPSGDNRYAMGLTGYIGPTGIDTVYHDGKIIAIGPVALEKDGRLSEMKAGEWTEFYPNGQVRSKGAYEMDSYLECCYIGPCRQYVNYKKGSWTYYYDNGQVKASGRYQVGSKRPYTNCGTGPNVKTSHTDESWMYYNEKGDRIEPIDLEH